MRLEWRYNSRKFATYKEDSMKERSGFLCLLAILQTAVVFLAASVVLAQAAPGKFAFEAATVRPSAPLDMEKLAAEVRAGRLPRLGVHVDASRAEEFYLPLKDLIAYAYDVKAYQIAGPDWLARESFDIVAKIPDGVSKDNAPAMMQTLLADRFGLVVHHSKHEQRVLALVIGKRGPKLKKSPAATQPIDENAPLKPGETKLEGQDGPILVIQHPDGSVTINMGSKGIITQKFDRQSHVLHLESSNVTMAGFADMLTKILQRGGLQVVDMTGLKGSYQVAIDIALKDMMGMARAQGYTPPISPASSAASSNILAESATELGVGPNIYDSIEKLGLKLKDRKAMVEQLVVDHVEKTPTTN